MGSELNPITVAALLARMITLQYPEYNFPGDVKVTEPERQLAKKLFEIVVNLVADAKEVGDGVQNIDQMQRGEQIQPDIETRRKKNASNQDTLKTKATTSNVNSVKIKSERNETALGRSCSASSSEAVAKNNSPDQNVLVVNDRVIKREVEELHISNINLHENFQQKVPSSVRHSSSTDIKSSETKRGEPSGIIKINHSAKKDEKQDSIPDSLNSTKPEVLPPKISKRTTETCTSPQSDDPDIICLDDSDDDAGKISSTPNPSLNKQAKISPASRSINSKTVDSSLMNKKSRLQKEELKADAIKNAMKMENFTLAEFSRMREEKRNVLGADLRRWATIRACTYNDFEYQVGEEWVKYFVKKYKIIYDKNIRSLVFEREKLSSLTPKRRKSINNKNRK